MVSQKSFSDFIKLLGKSLLVILISVILGTGLLAAVSFIPREAVWENSEVSANLLLKEGYGIGVLDLRGSQLDVFTDSIMISTAFTSAGDLHSTMMAERVVRARDDDPLDSLLQFLEGDGEGLEMGDYARYWHGYLIFLRPLLCIGNLISIRALNMIIQFALVAFAIILLVRKGGRKMSLAIPFFVLWLCLSPVAISASLQFYSVFYSMMFAVIALLLFKEFTFNKVWYVFLITGIFIGYFDLLTYPMVSLGVPLILYLSLDYSSKKPLLGRLWECVAFSGVWCMGYLGMFVSRWLIAGAISDKNIIQEGFWSITYRTMHEYEGTAYTLIGTLKRNLADQLNQLAVFAVLLGFLLFVISIPKLQKGMNLAAAVALLFVSAYTIIWYFVVMQHSNLHHWMTYRNWCVAIYGIMSLIFVHIDYDKRKGSLSDEFEK